MHHPPRHRGEKPPLWSLARAICAVVVAFFLAPTAPAHACSPALCWSGSIVPSGGEVPANLPAIYWQPFGTTSAAAADKVSLRTDDGKSVELKADLPGHTTSYGLLSPVAMLEPGVRYRIEDGNTCDDGGAGKRLTATFIAAAARPLPSKLGSLRVVDKGYDAALQVAGGGACWQPIAARVAHVILEPAPEAAPWMGVLHFVTMVDGKRWRDATSSVEPIPPGASTLGRGIDRVYANCGSGRGLAEGTHRVSFIARLFGTSIELHTPEVTVELRCSDMIDGGVGPGADGGEHETTAARRTGCAIGGRDGGWGALAMLVIALAVRRRRRP